MKPANNKSTTEKAKDDIVVIGKNDQFQLIYKVSSTKKGWMKSTKAMEIEGLGCIVQVTTRHDKNVAEALTFVPGITIVDDVNGGHKLVVKNPVASAGGVDQTGAE